MIRFILFSSIKMEDKSGLRKVVPMSCLINKWRVKKVKRNLINLFCNERPVYSPDSLYNMCMSAVDNTISYKPEWINDYNLDFHDLPEDVRLDFQLKYRKRFKLSAYVIVDINDQVIEPTFYSTFCEYCSRNNIDFLNDTYEFCGEYNQVRVNRYTRYFFYDKYHEWEYYGEFDNEDSIINRFYSLFTCEQCGEIEKETFKYCPEIKHIVDVNRFLFDNEKLCANDILNNFINKNY